MLKSPSGKSYIGQTMRSIEKRLEEHRTGKIGCVAIYNAIQYHGWDNFEKDWYECPDEDLNFDEELLVKEMGTLSPSGYNLREGGGGNGKMSDESRQKISEAKRGEKHPMYGKTRTEETKHRISEATKGEKNHMYGIPKSDEIKKKLSDALRGEKHPMYGKTMCEESKQKQREAKRGDKNKTSKRVYQYDIDGTFIVAFGSCGEAARHLKRKEDGTFIGMCARGKSKTAYGFKWSYIKH